MSRVSSESRPPGERDADAAERPGLLEVVAHAQRQRVEQVLAQRPRAALRRVSGAGRKKLACGGTGIREPLAAGGELRRGHAPARAPAALAGVGLAVGAPGGVLRAQAGGAVQVHHAGREALLEARGLEHPPAVLVDEAAAVEDEPVVRAHRVRVGDGALVVGRAGGDAARGASAPPRCGRARPRRSPPARRPSRCAGAWGRRRSRGPRTPRRPRCRSRSGRGGRRSGTPRCSSSMPGVPREKVRPS